MPAPCGPGRPSSQQWRALKLRPVGISTQELIRLDDLSGNRRSGHDVGRGEIEFAGTAATGKVSVLRADGYRLGCFRGSGAGVNTGSAGRIDQFRARFGEDLDI